MALLADPQAEPVKRNAQVTAAIVGAIFVGAVGFAAALIALLQAFGVNLTDAQAGAIQQFIQVIVGIGGSVLAILKGGDMTREQVVPVDRHDQEVALAFNAGQDAANASPVGEV